MSQDYVYVFVRKDLSYPQICVQSIHAVIEHCKNFSPYENVHPNVIVFEVEDEESLILEMNKLSNKGVDLVPFYEPDINNSLTSFACKTVSGLNRKTFSKYKLLGEKK